nr:chemotaxis protein CheD [uncultured Aquabacterium sp.]
MTPPTPSGRHGVPGLLPTLPPTLPLPVFDTNGMLESGSLSRPGVFLRPGDWFFGRGEHGVTTVLGSCVSVVMWSPRLKLGAMSHCLLPTRPDHPVGTPHGAGHYLDEALEWMTQRLLQQGCRPMEVDVTVAGGATAHDIAIGGANVAQALRLIAPTGMRLIQQDTGGRVVRRLTFNLSDGCLTISHGGRLGPNEV